MRGYLGIRSFYRVGERDRGCIDEALSEGCEQVVAQGPKIERKLSEDLCDLGLD